MVTAPSFKNMSIVEYSGSGTTPDREVLSKDKDVHGGVVYVLDMGTVDPGGTAPVSAEKTIGIHVPNHSKIKSVKAALVNGIMGHNLGDVKLNAGVESSYTANAAAGTASTIATSEIPKASILNNMLAIPDFDATEKDYQFVKLQLEALTTADTWDPAKALDNIPYYLVDFSVCLEEKYAFLSPTGNAPSLYMNKTNTEVYVNYNGSLQAIGCLNNAMELATTINQAVINKGATESVVDIAVGSRENAISGGESYGYSPWLWNNMLHGSLTEETDWISMDIDSGWKRIENMEFFIQTHTSGGHDVVIWIPNGVLMADGNSPLGSENASLKFKIEILNNFSVKTSKDKWDHIKLAILGDVA
jgi:hypothetical protein